MFAWFTRCAAMAGLMACAAAGVTLQLSNTLSDGMVLQRAPASATVPSCWFTDCSPHHLLHRTGVGLRLPRGQREHHAR